MDRQPYRRGRSPDLANGRSGHRKPLRRHTGSTSCKAEKVDHQSQQRPPHPGDIIPQWHRAQYQTSCRLAPISAMPEHSVDVFREAPRRHLLEVKPLTIECGSFIVASGVTMTMPGSIMTLGFSD